MKDKPDDKPAKSEDKNFPATDLTASGLGDVRRLQQTESLKDGFELAGSPRAWLRDMAYQPPVDSGQEVVQQAARLISEIGKKLA